MKQDNRPEFAVEDHYTEVGIIRYVRSEVNGTRFIGVIVPNVDLAMHIDWRGFAFAYFHGVLQSELDNRYETQEAAQADMEKWIIDYGKLEGVVT